MRLFFALLAFIISLAGLPQQRIDLPLPQHLGPSCQFSVLNYCYGDTVYFINQTIRMMNPSWEISDSSGIIYSSTDTNIKFFFPSLGTYSITLRADNGHPDSITKTLVIDTATKASFDFQQCSQQFINMSSCSATFYWDFGDGAFSTALFPVHLYADTGFYTVTMIAAAGTMIDSMVQTIYVYSRGFPTADFTYFQSNDTVYFFGDTLADNFNWDFGDQTTSVLKNPIHVYPDTGDYFVSLSVNNYCDVKWQSQLIHVFPSLGVTASQDQNHFLAFPNPNAGQFTIMSSEEISQIEIFTVLGKNVHSEKASGKQVALALGNLSDGAHIIKVFYKKGGSSAGKIILH